MDNYFDCNASKQINKLIKIIFPQNMKSMEKFYRWLNVQYYKNFGELHKPLTDTIFKYNYRDRKGLYLKKFSPVINVRSS